MSAHYFHTSINIDAQLYMNAVFSLLIQIALLDK